MTAVHPVRYSQKDLQDIIKSVLRNGDWMIKNSTSTLPVMVELCALEMFRHGEIVTDRAMLVRQALNDLRTEGVFVYR